MTNNSNMFAIFSMRLAANLMLNGFPLIGISNSKTHNNKKVYYFKNP